MSSARGLTETVTLSQAKELIRCLAHEQSVLLLSPPGVGKSDVVRQAAAASRAARASRCSARRSPRRTSAACRGSSASAACSARRACCCPRTPRAVLPVPRRAAGLRPGRAEGVLLAAAGAPHRRAPAAEGDVGRRGRQPRRGQGARADDLQRPREPRADPERPDRRGRVARVGAAANGCARTSCSSSSDNPDALLRPVPDKAGAVLDAAGVGVAVARSIWSARAADGDRRHGVGRVSEDDARRSPRVAGRRPSRTSRRN